jgi:hypothetical protein
MASGAGVLIIVAAAAASLGPATGVLIIAAAAAAALGRATGVLFIAATAAFRNSRMLAGAAARSGSVWHCVRCILCRFALGVSALHVHRIHGSSPCILSCISIFRHLNTTLSELKTQPLILVPVSELWSM